MKKILLQIESAMTWPVTELKNLPQTFVPGLTAMAMADRAKVVPPGIYNDTSIFLTLTKQLSLFQPNVVSTPLTSKQLQFVWCPRWTFKVKF